MVNLKSLLGVEQWVADSFPYVQAALIVIMAAACIVMIIAILASPPEAGKGSNAITGAAESFYTKNKGKNNQGRIRNLIIICACVISVAAIMYFISYSIYQGQF